MYLYLSKYAISLTNKDCTVKLSRNSKFLNCHTKIIQGGKKKFFTYYRETYCNSTFFWLDYSLFHLEIIFYIAEIVIIKEWLFYCFFTCKSISNSKNKMIIDKSWKYSSEILIMISTERHTIRLISTKLVDKFIEFNR